MVGILFAQVDAFDIAFDFEEAFILRRTAQDKGQSRRIGRNGAGDGKSLSSGFMFVVGTMTIS